MIFADTKDIFRCSKIIKNEFAKTELNLDDVVLNKITVEIMNISYSHGGDYTDGVIQSFAETYIEKGFYKKYL